LSKLSTSREGKSYCRSGPAALTGDRLDETHRGRDPM
jgi:hypothetical protein